MRSRREKALALKEAGYSLYSRKLGSSGRQYAITDWLLYHDFLPTPTHSDRLTAGCKKCKPGQTQHLATAVRPKNMEGYLNPEFTERMMGFPAGWSSINSCDATPELMSFDTLPKYVDKAIDNEDVPNRRKRLGAIGNAVVPHVAAVAIEIGLWVSWAIE